MAVSSQLHSIDLPMPQKTHFVLFRLPGLFGAVVRINDVLL